jgi:hypothetical protein
MFTISALLVLAAFILTIAHAGWKTPLWPAVLCAVIVEALTLYGVR